MKSSVTFHRNGSISFRGGAARQAFEGMTGRRIPKPADEQAACDAMIMVNGISGAFMLERVAPRQGGKKQ